jgi:hypothetical protein
VQERQVRRPTPKGGWRTFTHRPNSRRPGLVIVHLAKRVDDPMWDCSRRKPWSALCGPDDKAWYGDAEPVKVREIPSKVSCRRCIRLAGFEGVKPMPITIDFEGVNSEGFAPIEDGTYAATVTGVKAANARSSGKPMLEMEFTLEPGENKALANRKLWRNYSLQPNALWNLKQTLVRLGIEVPDGELALEPDEIIGKKCQLVVSLKDAWDNAQEADPDNPGQTRTKKQNDVDEVLSPSDAQGFGW